MAAGIVNDTRTVDGELAHLRRGLEKHRRNRAHVANPPDGICPGCEDMLERAESKRPRQAEDTGRAETEGSEGGGVEPKALRTN